MSDQVVNPEDRYSRDEAKMGLQAYRNGLLTSKKQESMFWVFEMLAIVLGRSVNLIDIINRTISHRGSVLDHQYERGTMPAQWLFSTR